jgi:hypothetical protein
MWLLLSTRGDRRAITAGESAAAVAEMRDVLGAGVTLRVRMQILADVDKEAADVSETVDGAGKNMLMSARHVWHEHIQRRAHACATTLAALRDDLIFRSRHAADPALAAAAAPAGSAHAPAAAASAAQTAAPGAGAATEAVSGRAYEDLKLEEWMREDRQPWEEALHREIDGLQEQINETRNKRLKLENDTRNLQVRGTLARSATLQPRIHRAVVARSWSIE